MFQSQMSVDISGLSQAEDLCSFGMQLFYATGHTFNTEATISNSDIKDFMYVTIRHNQVLTPNEWYAISRVKSISLLFSNGAQYFCSPSRNGRIDYFSISLCASNSDRSTLAYAVHQTFSRLLEAALSVILFEVNGYYMFSFAERKERQLSSIVFSNWFSLPDIIDIEFLIRIDAANFKGDCARDFFYDFEYAIARSYYIYPISYEYAGYEMFPPKLLCGIEKDLIDRETVNEIVKENYLLPLREYRDDYIFEEDGNQEMQSFSTDDFSLELLEIEMEAAEADEEEMLTEDDDLTCEEYDPIEDDDYINDLDEELFSDPIKMLKWIEKHSR